MSPRLEEWSDRLHLAVALLSLWLVGPSPWIAMLRRIPAGADWLDHAHVALGLVTLPLGCAYLWACTRGGRWRLYYPLTPTRLVPSATTALDYCAVVARLPRAAACSAWSRACCSSRCWPRRQPAPRGSLRRARAQRSTGPHFEYIAGEVAKGVAMAGLETGVPIAFGVLTTDCIEQAVERAGTKAGNKGFDAACEAIEMANLLRELK